MTNLFRNYPILLLILFIVSCDDKEDDKEIHNAADIIGTWTLGSASFEMTIDNKDFIEYFMAEFGLTEEEAAEYEALYEDLFDFSDVMAQLKFESSGSYTAFTADTVSGTGTWELNADATQLTFDPGTVDEGALDVYKLTSSELSLGVSETSSEDINQDNVKEELFVEFIINFTK